MRESTGELIKIVEEKKAIESSDNLAEKDVPAIKKEPKITIGVSRRSYGSSIEN